MRFSSSTAPAPDPGRQPQPEPAPGPTIVPAPTPPSRRRAWGVSLIIAAAVLGGLAYYWHSAGAARTTGGGPATYVPTASASVGSIDSTVRINGTIAAANQATLLAPRIQGSRSNVNRGGSANFGGGGGRGGNAGGGGGGGGGGPQGFGAGMMNDFSLVLMYLAPAGSRVKAGDVVARFDPQMQQQRLDDYTDQLIQMDANIKRRMADLGASRESHLQRVRSACAQAQQAVLDQQTNEVVSAIQAQLYDLNVEQQTANCKQLQYEDNLVDQQQQAQIRAIELNRDQADVELQRSKANIEKLTIKAPIDGIVVMASIVRNNEFGQVQNGDEVRAGMPFMYIVDPNSMVLNATVNQVDAERLRLGMNARVRLDAYSDINVPGTLDGIGALSKTSTFRANYVSEIPVRLKLNKMDPRIIPDLTASAEVNLASEQNALVLPRTAVFEDKGSKYVFLRTPQGWMRKPVETGVVTYTKVSVRTGVQKGDVVALQRPM